jgi:hypothetical protein
MAAGDLCQSGRAFQAHDPESFGFHPAKIPARSAADIQDQAAGGEAVREGRQEGGGVDGEGVLVVGLGVDVVVVGHFFVFSMPRVFPVFCPMPWRIFPILKALCLQHDSRGGKSVKSLKAFVIE